MNVYGGFNPRPLEVTRRATVPCAAATNGASRTTRAYACRWKVRRPPPVAGRDAGRVFPLDSFHGSPGEPQLTCIPQPTKASGYRHAREATAHLRSACHAASPMQTDAPISARHAHCHTDTAMRFRGSGRSCVRARRRAVCGAGRRAIPGAF